MSKKKREILLLEPGYKNKYPPIGLMKIATYHRELGDNVRFFKGGVKDLILEHILAECIEKLNYLEPKIDWIKRKIKIIDYLNKGHKLVLQELVKGVHRSNIAFVVEWIIHYRNILSKKQTDYYPKWDRVYVTTLFTFYWKVTIKTIEDAKHLVKNDDLKELKVGGVLASLIPELVYEATGIKPIEGLLDKPGILDKGNKHIIDEMPLDYSILYEIDYEYPTQSAYFTFMTKGCTRKCSFCAVPKIETTYKPKIETLDKYQAIKDRFGDQQHLLLMDNNVLASPKFPEIIDEIKALGFVKNAKYEEPNQLDIAITNLKENYNDRAFIRRVFFLLDNLKPRIKNSKEKEKYNKIILEYQLNSLDIISKKNILEAYPLIQPIFEKNRIKTYRKRYVDFNQGTDARYVTDELMKKMSEIPINPLRIAFDYIGMKKQYVAAVELAAKHDINKLSNYLLYNFVDKPEDLYERMKINIDLSEKLNISIYSFPMKYIPLYGEEAKGRKHIGKHWNAKFIRSIQIILNVTKGIVMDGRSFFEKAFGRNLSEFFEILYMPAPYILYRKLFEEELKYTEIWLNQFRSLTEQELIEAKTIIEQSDFSNITKKTQNPNIRELLKHYSVIKPNDIGPKKQLQVLKDKYDKLIKKDMFLDLTLTYDFDGSMVEE